MTFQDIKPEVLVCRIGIGTAVLATGEQVMKKPIFPSMQLHPEALWS
jgi:hypothetical protein